MHEMGPQIIPEPGSNRWHHELEKEYDSLAIWLSSSKCVDHFQTTYRAFTLVLGTVPARVCSRNMFSVHTPGVHTCSRFTPFLVV